MSNNKNNNNLSRIFTNSKNIVFFGGAGVSTESHIPDFRSSNGLYSKDQTYSYSPEMILSHSFFVNHTEEFYQFYRSKMIYRDAKPNKAHVILAELEKEGKLSAVITQNIDNLHQAAGSKKVLELHGSVYRNYCMSCHNSYSLDFIMNSDSIPICSKCGGIVKPDVVLYEEPLDMNTLNQAVLAIQKADILIIGGTSLMVYPAASLVEYYQGNKLILINKEVTPYDNKADLVLHENIGQTMEAIKKATM